MVRRSGAFRWWPWCCWPSPTGPDLPVADSGSSQLDADVFRFGEELERIEPALAADAAFLHAAEGNAQVAQEPRIDPDRSALDRRGDPMGLLEVPGPDARR